MALLGLPVEAVRTTGIYCRSGCVAKPHLKNLTWYSSPVAAQASGYRPCLKCRPDRAPDARPLDLPAAVAHAVLLISDGYLDHHHEHDLARQVGYSERQLRRLFLQHVGATATDIAMSRRAHFARRLLDESDLNVGDIAFAAGFSSVRQMNRVMLDVFRFSPTELRAKRFKHDRLVTDGGLPLRVPTPDPYDAASVLAYLAERATPGVESVDDGTYRRTVVSCGAPGLIEVTPREGHLLVTAHLSTFIALIDLVGQVRRLFGITDDPIAAAQAFESDPTLAPLVRRYPGVPIPGAWDHFETTIRIILGQQITVAGASTFAGRIANELGGAVAGLPFGLSRTFPSPATVANHDLAGFGLTTSRATTVRTVSGLVAAGELDLIGSGDLAADLQKLQRIKGIGPWTAQLIAFRVMGYRDVFPAGDLVVRKALGAAMGRDVVPGITEAATLAETWSPHRTAAATLLWASAADRS